MKDWQQGYNFCFKSIYEYVLFDSLGGAYAQLFWHMETAPSGDSIWVLVVRGQPVAWCCCRDYPVLDDGTQAAQAWFGGEYPCKQNPFGAVCCHENSQPPVWTGITPSIGTRQCPPPSDQSSMQQLAQLMTHQFKQLHERIEQQAADTHTVYENRFTAIEHGRVEDWYAHEESINNAHLQTLKHVDSITDQLQKANDTHIDQVDKRCKRWEEYTEECHKATSEDVNARIEAVAESTASTCKQAVEDATAQANAALQTTEFMLRDVKQELRQEITAEVKEDITAEVTAEVTAELFNTLRSVAVQRAQLALEAASLYALCNSLPSSEGTKRLLDDDEEDEGRHNRRRVVLGKWV